MSIRYDSNDWQNHFVQPPAVTGKLQTRMYGWGTSYRDRVGANVDLSSNPVMSWFLDLWEESRAWDMDSGIPISSEWSKFLGSDWSAWKDGHVHLKRDLEDVSCDLLEGVWEIYEAGSDASEFALMLCRLWKGGRYSAWFQPRLPMLYIARTISIHSASCAMQWEILKGVDNRGRPRK
jgi:hypothetical protein